MDPLPPIPPPRWTAAPKSNKGGPRTASFVLDKSKPGEFQALALGVTPEALTEPVAEPGLTPRQLEHARAVIAELQRRSIEALKLYEPLPSQLEFHLSMARQRISRGSNRSGKSTVTLVELAMAVTGQHYQPDKYPKENGRAIVVAKDEEKIGEVIWKKLGRAYCFKMVRDPETKQWRAYRPATDQGLKFKYAPPLIPPRMIKEIAWYSKKSGIPRKVILKNGWEINFYSSKSDPFSIQGTDIDLVLFDEEIVHHDWFPEAITRLVDRAGWFMWGATPQTGTQQLYDLHLRAESWRDDVEAGLASPSDVPPVVECFMSVFDNPHLPEKARDEWIESLDEDQRRVRVQGEFAISGIKIYDAYFFPRGIHGVEPFPVPASWTRFAFIDPGAQVCAVLFAAVPPMKAPLVLEEGVERGHYGDFVYFYDELYLRPCDARKLATRMSQKIGGQEIYEFVIDHHGGRLTEIGSGKTPEQQYREAFRDLKVASTKTGHSFTWGSDDLNGGILRVKEYMRVRDDGTAKLRFLRGRCPKAVDELAKYQWRVVMGEITEHPLKRHDHQCDNVRYCCMLPSLKYQKPKPKAGKTGSAYDSYIEFKKQEKKRKLSKNGPGVTLG